MNESGDQAASIRYLRKTGKNNSINVKIVYKANGSSRPVYLDPKEDQAYQDIKKKYNRPTRD